MHAQTKLRSIAAVTALALTSTIVLGAVDKEKAMYMGGTMIGIDEKSEGRINTASEDEFKFNAEGGSIAIPYARVTSLEYGQKAGRRVAVGILISPLALFSKKRNHYLTITFKDRAGKEQAGVFELGKDIVRTTLKVLEVRTGKDIEFQDVDACKQYRTPRECEATR